MKHPTVTYWMGRDGDRKIVDMSRDELVEVIEELSKELDYTRSSAISSIRTMGLIVREAARLRS